MKRAPAVIALLVLAAALTAAAVPSDSEGAEQTAYPDADVLIYEEDGRVAVEYVGSHTETYASGADVTVASNSEKSGSLSVVMVSGTLGELPLLEVDGVSPSVDLDFTMVSGTLERLVAVSADDDAELPESYYSAYRAVDSLVMTIGGGVTEVLTTADRVEVGSLELTVTSSAVVDRLFPTGDDGAYGDVTVALEGGTVGYMTNRAAVVSTLTYDLRAGSIRYFCIGSDTESGVFDIWAFHVRGDVSVTIGSSCVIANAVVGGGVISAPSVLRSGEEPETLLSRTVVIDAPGAEIAGTSCFLTNSGRAYRLASYTIGATPVARVLAQDYGEGGVWGSASGQTVGGGTVLYLNTVYDVVSGSVFGVEAGGRVVNAGYIELSGTMESSGTVTNNGIIEVLPTGSFEGEASGTGFVAAGLSASVIDSRIDVMITGFDAVVVRSSSGDVVFDEMSVNLSGISSSVVVSPAGSSFQGEAFIVGLSLTEGDGYDSECRLLLSGFGDDGLTARVTVPVTVPSGYLVTVADSSGAELEIVSCADGYLVFDVAGSGTYSVSVHPEAEEEGDETDPALLINAAIAVAIVVVAAIVVYMLLRRD